MPDRTPASLVLCVRPDGAVECLHSDELGLEQLGPMEVKRASNVEYDAARQAWYVEDATTATRLFEHTSRGACLDWEREHYNQALAAGLRPFDPAPTT